MVGAECKIDPAMEIGAAKSQTSYSQYGRYKTERFNSEERQEPCSPPPSALLNPAPLLESALLPLGYIIREGAWAVQQDVWRVLMLCSHINDNDAEVFLVYRNIALSNTL